MRRSLVLMLIGMSALPGIADAQTVIMRKTLGGKLVGTGSGGDKPPIVTPAPTPTPTPTPAPAPVLGSWTTSAPRLIGPSCSATAPATRDVWCASADGTRLQDSGCAGEGVRPSTSTTMPNYDGCGHVWQPVGGTTWSSTCSDNATATRRYACQRQDGVQVDPSKCDASHQELETETGANLTTCVFEVSAWRSKSYSSTCSSKAVVTYEATGCIRSGGGEMPQQVSVSQCGAAGVPLTKDSIQEVYDGCDYTPVYSESYGACDGTKKTAPLVGCNRSDGQSVPASECLYAAPTKSVPCSFSTCGSMGASGRNWQNPTRIVPLGSATSHFTARDMCNAYVSNTTVKGVCFWEFQNPNNPNGPVTFYQNASMVSDASVTRALASTCQ